MLRGDANNSHGFLLFLELPYPVFVVNSRGVVMFSEMCGVFVNDVTKCVCMLLIVVCIKCSEIHMTGFLGRIFA